MPENTDDAARPAQAAAGAMPREILDLRGSIDNIDSALVHLLAERFKMTRRVGELKAVGGLPPADPSRDRQQIDRLKQIAGGAGRGSTPSSRSSSGTSSSPRSSGTTSASPRSTPLAASRASSPRWTPTLEGVRSEPGRQSA